MEYDDIREFIKMSCIVSVGVVIGFIIAIVTGISLVIPMSMGCTFACLLYSVASAVNKE